ncbi:Chaperone protein ClpD [Hibiscus syriacus]|uniref:Chaperone protein ClpD n=1 Tax=Hibiscus syriacus TaxID=106335 RepID=A0A6A3BNK5_HIBSY|nr:Chaperone protein ClpD [Hibiscus syriacus]
MEVLCSSSLPINFRSRCLFSHPSSPWRFPFHFHPNDNNSISSSSSTCFGLSISRCNNFIQVKRFHSRRRRIPFQISAVFERFTERTIKAVIISQREAKSLGNDMVFTQHLLLGLIGEDRDPKGFLGSGLNFDEAREAVRSIWQSSNHDGLGKQVGSSVPTTDVPFSASAKRVFEAAVEYSRNMGYNFISPEHIAIGLFTVDDGSAEKVLKRLGANVDLLAAAAVTRLQGELAKDGREPPLSSKKMPENSLSSNGAVLRSPKKARGESPLDQFCVDLTARASEGLIDPVIGRENEVQRTIQILCRKSKNNPILLGESGVGKTAIAEGLAIRIAQAEIPTLLLSKRIMSLDIGLLMAGAKERGELEARVTALLNETIKSGDVILFIDEVHTLVGSGSVDRGNKGSGLDISNLLKPALGRGELQCMASTTIVEYRTQFEKDKALARRFQPVWINEPSQDDAVEILLGLQEKYESHHHCRYTREAINAAVYLSARYITDRHLPDKAIDLIDEAGKIKTVQAMHEVVLASRLKHDDGASDVNDSSKVCLESQLSSASDDDEPITVGPEEIAAVASVWSGIPVQQITADERMLLVGLEEQLKKRVIGQNEAVAAISRAVKRSRVGLKDPDRPIAAMIFCGPTGVGKTELTKALAACYFGSEDAMLRLDMSEYMERHTGRRVSFKNALVVMTSNVGSSAIAKGRRGSIGFLLEDNESASYAGMKALVMEELKAYFRPELLNRIDEVVVFQSLEKTQMLEIVNLMLQEVKARLMALGIGLEVSDSIKDLVCERGYDKTFGARPLRRAVTALIEDPVSEAILAGEYKPGETVFLDIDASGNTIVSNRSDQKIIVSDAASIF